jgi:hypothetical protein
MGEEKRRHERFKVPQPVEVTWPDGRVSTMITRDVSDGGVFLESHDEPMPEIGAEVLLKVKGMLGDEEPPTVRSRVVRVVPDGIGLCFVDES